MNKLSELLYFHSQIYIHSALDIRLVWGVRFRTKGEGKYDSIISESERSLSGEKYLRIFLDYSRKHTTGNWSVFRGFAVGDLGLLSFLLVLSTIYLCLNLGCGATTQGLGFWRIMGFSVDLAITLEMKFVTSFQICI